MDGGSKERPRRREEDSRELHPARWCLGSRQKPFSHAISVARPSLDSATVLAHRHSRKLRALTDGKCELRTSAGQAKRERSR